MMADYHLRIFCDSCGYDHGSTNSKGILLFWNAGLNKIADPGRVCEKCGTVGDYRVELGRYEKPNSHIWWKPWAWKQSLWTIKETASDQS